MALSIHARQAVERLIGPIGKVISALGLTPNAITAGGVVLTSVAAWLVATGHLWAGGFVLIFGGLADLFDGMVARISGTGSRFGQFFDSVADRLCDGISLGAVAWAVHEDATLFALTAVALVTAQLTSYVRAKAEAMGLDCTVGWVERPERQLALMVGLLLSGVSIVFEVVLWLLAVGGTITVVQRLVHVTRQLRAEAQGAA